MFAVRTGRRCTVTFAEKNPAEDAKEAVQEAAKTVEEAVKEAAGDVRKAVPEDAGKGFDKVLARKQANKNRDKEGDLKHVRSSSSQLILRACDCVCSGTSAGSQYVQTATFIIVLEPDSHTISCPPENKNSCCMKWGARAASCIITMVHKLAGLAPSKLQAVMLTNGAKYGSCISRIFINT